LSQKTIKGGGEISDIPNNFCKVVPADNNIFYLVGGGAN
jgi:hypothetical protein